MAIAKCGRCGNMFDKVRGAVCPECVEAEEQDYDKIREILGHYEGMNLDAKHVAKLADVEVECVLRMHDDGRITTKELSGKVKCGMCGQPAISASKRLCHACLERLDTQVASQRAKIRLDKRKDIQVGEYLGARKSFEKKRKT